MDKKYYIGLDIGSISTKGVIIDEEDNVISHSYLWTEGDPINASKKVIEELKNGSDESIKISGLGTTGSARELIGTIFGATIIKNEITAHAIGTLRFHPDVRTIFEIGGQDSKIIIIDNGVVVDYAMNTLCAAGTGSFLSSQAKRLAIPVEDFGEYALRATRPSKIAGRCTVFAESDLVHKIQIGHSKEDIIAGLCDSIVNNYLNNVGKGKNIEAPIIFQGGVSKNIGVLKSFEKITGSDVMVDEYGHLMGAIGVAILSKQSDREIDFDFTIKDLEFKTTGFECGGCPNNCEIVCVLKSNKLLDAWGNRCEIGKEKAMTKYKE
ncbi:MAG: acyl-CoA dehydratase activase [Candidatus Pacebacteria bacterium]|nr:acyl-CoA dehydratase activase [Candidatus Paceibacterota bacterium]